MMNTPLISNDELDRLLNRAKGICETNRDTMYEALIYVRGTYERRIAELAAPQWEPVSQSLEYDLITHAIKHGEIPQGYRIYRSKEPMS